MNMKDFIKKYTNTKQSKKGFTMVEVIAVIVILSIISTATVSVFLSVQTTVRDTSKLTTQQYSTTQMEKFIRNELQTAANIDVYPLDPGFLPEGKVLEPNDEFMYFVGSTKQLIFINCDSSGGINTKLIIDQVEDVTIDICPLNSAAADTSNMPFKLIYKVKTTSYTYSGGIVLGNSYVDADDTFDSASILYGGNSASIHWFMNPDTDSDSSEYANPTGCNNDRCVTFHSMGTEST